MQFRRGGGLFDNIEPLFGGRGPRRPDFGNFKITPGTRRILYVAAFILLVLLVFNPLIGLYVDNLWFKSLNFQGIFTTRIAYQAWLFVAGFLVAFVVLALNGLFAVRLMGPTRLSQIGVKRRVLSSGLGRAVLGVAAVIAFFMGEIISGAWQEVALALNATSFGRTDPVFGQDVGYYVFQLPYLRTAVAWALALLIISLLGAALVYVSGITPGGQLELPPGALRAAEVRAAQRPHRLRLRGGGDRPLGSPAGLLAAASGLPSARRPAAGQHRPGAVNPAAGGARALADPGGGAAGARPRRLPGGGGEAQRAEPRA